MNSRGVVRGTLQVCDLASPVLFLHRTDGKIAATASWHSSASSGGTTERVLYFRKISGGFRSREWADAFLAFRSYLSTAAKQGANRLDAIQRLFSGDPWMPATSSAGP